MNKKIIIGIVSAIILIAVVISLIVIKLDKGNKPNVGPMGRDDTLYNNGNTAAEGMEPINKDMVLGDILQQVKENEVKKLTGITDAEAESLINLKEYSGLEKKVARYEDADEFTEIWLFKISKEEQAVNLFRMFNERIESLRDEYKDNEKISEILNNEKNIVMKQQAGIAIVIISDDIEKVETAVDLEFIR